MHQNVTVSLQTHQRIISLADAWHITLREATAIVIKDCYQIMRQCWCMGIGFDQEVNWFGLVMEAARDRVDRESPAPIEQAVVPHLRSPRVKDEATQLHVWEEVTKPLGMIAASLGRNTAETLEYLIAQYTSVSDRLIERGLFETEGQWWMNQIVNLTLIDWGPH